MGFTNIFKVHEVAETLADGLSVGGGQTDYSSELDLNGVNKVSIGYHIDSVIGSPSVTLQLSMGRDVNGTRHWVNVQDPNTSSDGIFTFDDEVEAARLQITETGGVDTLSGIKVWARGRVL